MRETIDEITAAVDSLMQLATRYERGQCIAWEDVEAISGDRTENRGKHIIRKWKNRMQKEREIVTRPAKSVGVRLLTHIEAAREVPRDRQRRAYRQIRRGIKETDTVDHTRLSDHERRVLVSQRRNMADTRRELFRSQQQLKEGIKPTETNPRRPQLVGS